MSKIDKMSDFVFEFVRELEGLAQEIDPETKIYFTGSAAASLEVPELDPCDIDLFIVIKDLDARIFCRILKQFTKNRIFVDHVPRKYTSKAEFVSTVVSNLRSPGLHSNLPINLIFTDNPQFLKRFNFNFTCVKYDSHGHKTCEPAYTQFLQDHKMKIVQNTNISTAKIISLVSRYNRLFDMSIVKKETLDETNR